MTQTQVVFQEKTESLQQLELDLLEAEDGCKFGPSWLTSLRTLTAQSDAMDVDAETHDSQHLNHQSHQMLCMYDIQSKSHQTLKSYFHFFTTQRYASVVYAVIMSVRPSIRLSHAGIAPKQLNVGSQKQHRTIAQGL